MFKNVSTKIGRSHKINLDTKIGKTVVLKNTVAIKKLKKDVKRNSQSIIRRHWIVSQAVSTVTRASNWHVNGVDMTTGAVADGWLSNYTSGKTGTVFFALGHLDLETTSSSPGYRNSQNPYFSSFWIKGTITGSLNSNIRYRMMLCKVKGALSPEDLPFYWSGGTTPDLESFTDKDSSSRIKRVYIDKIRTLVKYNDSTKQQTHTVNIFKKVNTKYFYGAPTQGSAGLTGVADGRHDIAEGTYNYYLVFATDEPTEAMAINLNILTNYS